MEALKAIWSLYIKRTINILISNWRESRIKKFTAEVPCELQKSFGLGYSMQMDHGRSESHFEHTYKENC